MHKFALKAGYVQSLVYGLFFGALKMYRYVFFHSTVILKNFPFVT